jgi:UDP-glucose 4-epimerase
MNPEQTILVTGAAGLLGSRVVRLLSRNLPEARIVAVSRNKDYVSHDPRVEAIYGDLRDKAFWISLPETITHVVHLAAVISWRPEQRLQASIVTDNVLPIANLIEYTQHWPSLQQVVYSSSISVYGHSTEWLNESSPAEPVNLYGAAKLCGEDLLSCFRARGVRTVSLRFSSLYARGQYAGTVLPILVNRAQQRQDLLIFGDGTRTQDFLHCEDAANAVLLALEQNANGVYNIGTGTPVTMTQLAETVSRVFANGESKIVYQPPRDDDPGIKLDVSKARRELNYEAQIPLESGLQKLKQEMENG